jgi:L-amino acid N-acyltransferase YncA
VTEPTAVSPSIRAAVPEDAGRIAPIFEHYVRETRITFELVAPTADQWADRIEGSATGRHPFLVAEVAGTVAGYAYAGPWRPKPAYDRTVENSIYLDPEATGRGLGAALLSSLIDQSTEAGFETMIAVIADVGIAASIRLHERTGFRHVGRLERVGFKHGRWTDTILMQLGLGSRTTHAEEPSHG